ncbi:gamma-glutamylputrescine oxidase [Arboricoccus pini]|uniref:Gamma-glutamylputrescine oxidase n=1 Tax=Arboricoccus pini TaxID=1963835 RepID=A0A212R464_9PROT|nr:FAD-dependent oxidoreductase [Arboricoccus pini]SNB66830.1 gamma-glutamylputrescine oxidase [Arboricoccus pini]
MSDPHRPVIARPDAPTWYHRSSREPALVLDPLVETIETEVCVVGGGLAGLATCLSLVERGLDAVLIESGNPGDGASGRNGGMASSGFTRGALDLEGSLGTEHTRRLHAHSVAALDLIQRRVQRYGIAADLVPGVLVASFFDDPRGLRAEFQALNERFATRVELCSREWMAATYKTARYTEGLLDPDGFHLNPLALSRGYARASLDGGARLYAHTQATAVERAGSGWRVLTAGSHGRHAHPPASITARHVVLATNVYGDGLVPPLRRSLLPVATYVIVTEPLGDLLGQVIKAPYAVFDDRFAVGYYRPLEDGRLLWGGRVSLREHQPNLSGLMRRDLAHVYPQLAHVPIASAWSGRMGFARHKMPLLGQIEPGLWMNTAYGGHGLNTTTMGGDLVARAIAEDDKAIEDFAVFQPQPVFGPMGRLIAQGIYWGMSAKDNVRLRLQHRRASWKEGRSRH